MRNLSCRAGAALWLCTAGPAALAGSPRIHAAAISARERSAAQRPIGQFSANQGWLHRPPVATPIGGSARGYQEPVVPLAGATGGRPGRRPGRIADQAIRHLLSSAQFLRYACRPAVKRCCGSGAERGAIGAGLAVTCPAARVWRSAAVRAWLNGPMPAWFNGACVDRSWGLDPGIRPVRAAGEGTRSRRRRVSGQ
jgi:hypothetical protein